MSSASPPAWRGESDTRPGPRAIVAGHGAFPEGMISAVEQITGFVDVFIPLSNQGLSGEDIEGRLRERSSETGVVVFFTDLPAGSATLAVRRIMRDRSDTVLVTGANLVTLLEFAFHAELSPIEAAALAAEKGRSSLVAQGHA